MEGIVKWRGLKSQGPLYNTGDMGEWNEWSRWVFISQIFIPTPANQWTPLDNSLDYDINQVDSQPLKFSLIVPGRYQPTGMSNITRSVGVQVGSPLGQLQNASVQVDGTCGNHNESPFEHWTCQTPEQQDVGNDDRLSLEHWTCQTPQLEDVQAGHGDDSILYVNSFRQKRQPDLKSKVGLVQCWITWYIRVSRCVCRYAVIIIKTITT